MSGYTLRRFYFKHKNGIKIAGLCVIILCSIGVLCAVRHHQNEKIRSALADLSEETEHQEEVTIDGQKTGVKGSEVKAQLASLKESEPYAIIVATEELLLERTTTESAYLSYPLDDEKQPQYVDATDGSRYMLFGVNYGNVLYDPVLYSIGNGGYGYYTIAGFMDESEYASRNNYSVGTTKTVITRNKYHPYSPDNSLPINNEDVFQKSYIYDKNEKEIGCIYYVE